MGSNSGSSSPAPSLPENIKNLMDEIMEYATEPENNNDYNDNQDLERSQEVPSKPPLGQNFQSDGGIEIEFDANFEKGTNNEEDISASKVVVLQNVEIIYDCLVDVVAHQNSHDVTNSSVIVLATGDSNDFAPVQGNIQGAMRRENTEACAAETNEVTQMPEEKEEEREQTTRKITKKRLRNPEQWVQNVRKANRESGKAYVDRKGKNHPPRQVGVTTCRQHCTFNCRNNFKEKDRALIFSQFWKLSDGKKSHFYSKFIKRKLVSRRRVEIAPNKKPKKLYSYLYFFEVDSRRSKVCKEFFLSTLNISSRRVYYFFDRVENTRTNVPRSPTKGKARLCNRVSEESKEYVRQHIRSFPCIDSHYCRRDTSKKYLDASLSIRRMYDLYLQFLPLQATSVKMSMYAKIFNCEFNLSFYKPKKDLCDKCEEFKIIKTPTEDQKKAFEEHLRRKNMGRIERNRDRDENVLAADTAVITFDLENVFALPKCNIGKAFYLKKLNCYNLTGHCSTNGVTYCSIWHEYMSGRAGNHLASALIKILKTVVEDNPMLSKIILWSDSCVPQNKNSIMSTALQHFLQSDDSKNVKYIEQKFSEPGHGNLQEVDAVHSVIERYLRHKDIFGPLSLIRQLMHIPNHYKTKLRVLQMQLKDFLNYQSVAQQYVYNVIPYTKVKHIAYSSSSTFTLSHRNSFEDKLEVTKIQRSTPSSRSSKKCETAETELNAFININQLSKTNSGLSKDKKDHLRLLTKFMDGGDLEFMNTLLRNTTTDEEQQKEDADKTVKANITTKEAKAGPCSIKTNTAPKKAGPSSIKTNTTAKKAKAGPSFTKTNTTAKKAGQSSLKTNTTAKEGKAGQSTTKTNTTANEGKAGRSTIKTNTTAKEVKAGTSKDKKRQNKPLLTKCTSAPAAKKQKTETKTERSQGCVRKLF